MIPLSKHSLFLALFFCTTVLSAVTYKIPIKRLYPDRREHARSSYSTPYYDYNPDRYGQNYPNLGYEPYYHHRRFASNDKFDDTQVTPEMQSNIYKMGETSGRELVVPDEWNDLNWVVLIGRKPNKKKGQFKRRDMVKIKEYKQRQHEEFLNPSYKYFVTKELETPTGLHKVAGPPYNDKVPLNVTYNDIMSHISAAASSVEEKKEIFIPSKQFIPSPMKSDPNSMNPIDPLSGRTIPIDPLSGRTIPIDPLSGRTIQSDVEASPSEPLSSRRSSSGRATHARSLDWTETKLKKFSDRPSYSFNAEDARPKTRTSRVFNLNAKQVPLSKRTGITSGENTVQFYATLGYPARTYGRISRHLLV